MATQEPRDALVRLNERLVAMEQELEQTRTRSLAQRGRAGRAIHLLLALIGALALLNLYYVSNMAGDVRVVARSMVEMYTNFGQMSERMQHIRQHVQSMGEQIRMMPVMTEQLQGMRGYMAQMRSDVEGMRDRMAQMQERVGTMNSDIREMAGRFRNMNRSVYGLGADVREMSDVVP
jgi:methyl-accepting chemotaxis protein